MDLAATLSYESYAPEVVWQSSQAANLTSLVRKSETKFQRQSSNSSFGIAKQNKLSSTRQTSHSSSTASLSSTSTLVSTSSSSWIDTPGLTKETQSTTGSSSFLTSASRALRQQRRPKTRSSLPEHDLHDQPTSEPPREQAPSQLSPEIPSGPQLELMIQRLGSSLKEKVKPTEEASGDMTHKTHKESAKHIDLKRKRPTSSGTSRKTHLERKLADRTNNGAKPHPRAPMLHSRADLRNDKPPDPATVPTVKAPEEGDITPNSSTARASTNFTKSKSAQLLPLMSPKSPFSRTTSYPPARLQGRSPTTSSTASSQPQPRQSKSDVLNNAMPSMLFAQQLVERTSSQRTIPIGGAIRHPSNTTPMSINSSKHPPKSLGMRIGRNSPQTSTIARNNHFKTPFKAPQPMNDAVASPWPSNSISQASQMTATTSNPKNAMVNLPATTGPQEADLDISMTSNVGDSSSSFECDLDELDKIMSIYE